MISSDNLLLEPHNYFEPSCFGSRGGGGGLSSLSLGIQTTLIIISHGFFPTVFFLRRGVDGKGNSSIGATRTIH